MAENFRTARKCYLCFDSASAQGFLGRYAGRTAPKLSGSLGFQGMSKHLVELGRSARISQNGYLRRIRPSEESVVKKQQMADLTFL